MIRILIADDHTVVRQGLAHILEKKNDIKIAVSCANGDDALKWLHKNDCDVAIIDIAMPGMNGIDLLKQLRKEKPKLPVLMFSAYPEDQYAVRLIKAGAAGYLNKESTPEEMLGAIYSVLDGKKYISPAVANLLAHEISQPDGRLPHETLSNREYQIFLLLASAKNLTEIAALLKLSVKTIGTYRSRILEKMNMHNNADMMRYVIDNNLMQ